MTPSAADAACPVMGFAKAPGEAKTRLVPALGAEGAAALHRPLVMHVLRVPRHSRGRPKVFGGDLPSHCGPCLAPERAARLVGHGPAGRPRASAAGDEVKQLLLVGGGHSHLAVLKSFGDTPAAGARLALLSPSRHAFYSGMVPGVVAGHYGHGDCRIDLAALAARAGARFLEDSAAGVDPARREVTTARGERLRYDVLSLDTGSSAGEPAGAAEHALRVRPVEPFLAGWERLRESARRGEVRRIAVVGGGAAGVEVLLAMRPGLAGSGAQFALFSELPVLAGHRARRRIVRILC